MADRALLRGDLRQASASAPVSSRTSAAGKTSMPALEMRKVCNPGRVAWPRILSTWILRTIELRWTLCSSDSRPSATVKTGLGSCCDRYSPIRKLVACQPLNWTPSCWINRCRLAASLGWRRDSSVTARTNRRTPALESRPRPRAQCAPAPGRNRPSSPRRSN